MIRLLFSVSTGTRRWRDVFGSQTMNHIVSALPLTLPLPFIRPQMWFQVQTVQEVLDYRDICSPRLCFPQDELLLCFISQCRLMVCLWPVHCSSFILLCFKCLLPKILIITHWPSCHLGGFSYREAQSVPVKHTFGHLG